LAGSPGTAAASPLHRRWERVTARANACTMAHRFPHRSPPIASIGRIVPLSDLTYRVELTPPDIEPYRAGNTGTEYATTFAAAAPGPHVMVCALTHGNEICGAIALDRLFRAGIRPRRGRLTLTFNNVAAYGEFDPRYPIASRYIDEDFNRLWHPDTLDGPRQSIELERARALRPLVDSADFLLDLHSMQYATAPLMLAGLLPRSRELALRVGIPELIMCDAGHAAGPRMRDYGGFGDPASPRTALLIECGQHWESRAAEVATDVMLRFLIVLGIVTRDDVAALGEADFAAMPRQRVIEVTEAVTIAGDHFDFAGDFRGLEVLAEKGTLIGRDGEREVLTPYDNCVLIMPSRRLVRGQTAVRLGRFVD
jgi:predicted deacylase